ncbi:hypothetical protein ACOME3_004575 [Neoechinorhynchus agilis]
MRTTIYLLEFACALLNVPFLSMLDIEVIDKYYHKKYQFYARSLETIEGDELLNNANCIRELKSRKERLLLSDHYRSAMILENYDWKFHDTFQTMGAYRCNRSMAMASVATICDLLRLPKEHCLAFAGMLIERHNMIERLVHKVFMGCEPCINKLSHRICYSKVELGFALIMVWFL